MFASAVIVLRETLEAALVLGIVAAATRSVRGRGTWMVAGVWRHAKWVGVAQAPYFVWVSIATVLQLSITAMNWGR